VKELFINRAKSCAITGHRVLYSDINIDKIKQSFLSLIKDGYDTFLVGMALGFDTLCFQILESIRLKENIKLIACIPCPSQSYKFTKDQKVEYDRMINSADEKVLISDVYDKTCMKKRNDYMVKNSSAIVCYLRRDFGGTFYTVNKAKRENLNIIKI
jgi:uncharacterized phage-like protein YoqJ